MRAFTAILVLLSAAAVFGENTCPVPRRNCQWRGNYLNAAWSDSKFSGDNYRRGLAEEAYNECCDLCSKAVGCYKFHVLQIVAPDPEVPDSGLVNCFLHGQGGKEVCYNIFDAPEEEASLSILTDGTDNIPQRRLLDKDSSTAFSLSGRTAGSNGNKYYTRDVSIEGTGGGDPHLVGFDGRPFDFQGYNGGVFNLFTQQAHHVNMLLTDNGMAGLTFIRALAFQYSDKRVKVEAAPFTKNGVEDALLTVEFNGMAVEVAALDSTNEPARLEAGDFWLSTRRNGNNTQEVHLTTPGMQIVVTKNRGSRHLDLTTSILRNDMEPMHGVLGQTYRFNETFAQFEGDEMDYRVSSLWANDCTYCKMFDGKAMPSLNRRILKASSTTPLKTAGANTQARPADWASSDLFKHIA